ncbi:hypothetical protein [Atlantibacter hermannii]|uniref:hypothetical protein n=1 Tax=Atlantibacter hermannii TaxID=565 RepID=UPI0035D50E07
MFVGAFQRTLNTGAAQHVTLGFMTVSTWLSGVILVQAKLSGGHAGDDFHVLAPPFLLLVLAIFVLQQKKINHKRIIITFTVSIDMKRPPEGGLMCD